MTSSSVRVALTGPQLRVLHESLSIILNDPADWPDLAAMNERDWRTLQRAAEVLTDGWRIASRAATVR